MITLLKLAKLPHKTMLRKLVLMLADAEVGLVHGKGRSLPELVALLSGVKARLENGIPDLIGRLEKENDDNLKRRYINNIRHEMLAFLGIEPSDWDFIDPDTGTLDESRRTVFPISVYLEDIRSPFNVGSIMRTADSFGISNVYLSKSTPLPTTKRAERTSRGTSAIIPWKVCDLEDISDEPFVFGLETGGIPIDEFRFPEAGTVIVGSEELGLSPEAMQFLRTKGGCVSIPLAGAKRSLNVSVAFGILMQRWFSSLCGTSTA
jgi:RNA methyltransferase, TrmH family